MLSLEKTLKRSDDIIAREIDGSYLLIPIAAGVGEQEDELFTVNEMGRRIWEEVDGQKTLAQIRDCLKTEFEVEQSELELDLLGFANELYARQILIDA